MKSRVFPFLAVVLILLTSLVFVGCGGASAKFVVENCTAAPNPVSAGKAATISAEVYNDGGAAGSYTATCLVGTSTVGSQTVELASKARQTVTFSYTPTTVGTYAVTIGDAKCSLQVTAQASDTGYWDVTYKVAGGSITLNYSMAKTTGVYKELILKEGDGSMIMRVNKSVVNGAREITLLKDDWQLASMFVKDVSPGVDMNLTISLSKDAKGTLYVQDGIGDVDANSVSKASTNPMQTNTYGDSKKDPAGSLLVEAVLWGDAPTSVGVDVSLPFGLTFTTGDTANTVSLTGSKFNGATLTGKGSPFAKSGTLAVADYVGTAGTITATGTGDCLGLQLAGVAIDFQTEIKLVLVPTSVK